MKFLKLLPIFGAVVLLGPSIAAEPPATAAKWHRDCATFVAVFDGETDGDDTELAYCAGATQGVLDGLETGSRVGAISMASMLTVTYGLDSADVFALFEAQSAKNLLQVCVPDDVGLAKKIKTIHRYIDANPDKAKLPVAAVFFDALQARYPCDEIAP